MFTISDIFSQAPEGPCEIAAIDLGSNSFHMIIARWQDGNITLLDRLKEPVRLGWGLTDGELNKQAEQRALDCLTRFGDRLKNFPKGSVRAVGTKTLRTLNNSQSFLQQAQNCLGHRIEIISGEEEARLIYRGVGHWLESQNPRRVVVDIGGGSTEVIVGSHQRILFKESLSMGCVAISNRFFSDNSIIAPAQIQRAQTFCLQEILPVRHYFEECFEECFEQNTEQNFENSVDSNSPQAPNLASANTLELLGASGTIKAVAKVCKAEGWSNGVITREYLARIKERFCNDGAKAEFLGLNEERQPVFLGGVCVLDAVFEGFGFQQLSERHPMRINMGGMLAADWALREGVLFELKGRMEKRDIRAHSVEALAQRFNVDVQKSKGVADTCESLFDALATPWQLPQSGRNLLVWASWLYTIGLDIRHSDYHKHSAYIIENADLAGCSQSEQQQLALLVRNHRKRLQTKRLEHLDQGFIRLIIILRLAVIIQRGSQIWPLPEWQINTSENSLELSFNKDFIDQQPLLLADLSCEVEQLTNINMHLTITIASD